MNFVAEDKTIKRADIKHAVMSESTSEGCTADSEQVRRSTLRQLQVVVGDLPLKQSIPTMGCWQLPSLSSLSLHVLTLLLLMHQPKRC